MANIFQPEWQFEIDQPPFRVRAARVGAQAGAERLGASLYEIQPGGQLSPLHVHYANEELIVVLSGNPTLRRADQSLTLTPGSVIACPVGRRGAHTIKNDTNQPTRVLIVSTMVYPEVAEHLDSNKVIVLTAPPDGAGEQGLMLAFPRDGAVDWHTGEVEED
jgi:uncharacterized cupin superfamily protein